MITGSVSYLCSLLSLTFLLVICVNQQKMARALCFCMPKCLPPSTNWLLANGSEAGMKGCKRIMFTVEVDEYSRQAHRHAHTLELNVTCWYHKPLPDMYQLLSYLVHIKHWPLSPQIQYLVHWIPSHSVINAVTRLWVGLLEKLFNSQQRQDSRLFSKASRLAVDPTQPLLNSCKEICSWDKAHVLKLITHLHLVPQSEDILGSEGMTPHFHIQHSSYFTHLTH
jgi:hypothetical protein